MKWFRRKKRADISPDDTTAQEQGLETGAKTPRVVETIGPNEEKLVAQVPKKGGVFVGLRNRLSNTRKAFTDRLDSLLLGRKEIDEDLFEGLEEILITSDVGVQTTAALIEKVKQRVKTEDLVDPRELNYALKSEIVTFLKETPSNPDNRVSSTPYVIMVVGVNGVGKTTTIGKIADRYMKHGQQVLLIAGDTFRAAAVEQLETWADRTGSEVIGHKGKPGVKTDPSAVVYDGIKAATARGSDVVIIDTAGRLHTKVNLMEQLKKIQRTVSRQIDDAPHEILLVLDATTGQNAISQARLFHEILGVTGIVLTKLDGTAKGGVVVGICHDLKLPIRYIGLGEKVDDLQDFDADAYASALF